MARDRLHSQHANRQIVEVTTHVENSLAHLPDVTAGVTMPAVSTAASPEQIDAVFRKEILNAQEKALGQGQNVHEVIQGLIDIGAARAQLHDGVGAKASWTKALDSMQSIIDPNERVAFLLSLASVQREASDLGSFLSTLEIVKKQAAKPDMNSLDRIDAYEQIAREYQLSNRPTDAVATIKQAAAIARTLSDPQQRDTAYKTLACSMADSGFRTEAYLLEERIRPENPEARIAALAYIGRQIAAESKIYAQGLLTRANNTAEIGQMNDPAFTREKADLALEPVRRAELQMQYQEVQREFAEAQRAANIQQVSVRRVAESERAHSCLERMIAIQTAVGEPAEAIKLMIEKAVIERELDLTSSRAVATLTQALSFAQSDANFNSTEEKVTSLITLAESQGKILKDSGAGRDSWDLAYDIASDSGNPKPLQLKVLRSQTIAGDFDGAMQHLVNSPVSPESVDLICDFAQGRLADSKTFYAEAEKPVLQEKDRDEPMQKYRDALKQGEHALSFALTTVHQMREEQQLVEGFGRVHQALIAAGRGEQAATIAGAIIPELEKLVGAETDVEKNLRLAELAKQVGEEVKAAAFWERAQVRIDEPSKLPLVDPDSPRTLRGSTDQERKIHELVVSRAQSGDFKGARAHADAIAKKDPFLAGTLYVDIAVAQKNHPTHGDGGEARAKLTLREAYSQAQKVRNSQARRDLLLLIGEEMGVPKSATFE